MCGLYGKIGSNTHYDKIKILGLAADSRGGTANGLYLNSINETIKGITTTALFSNLTTTLNYEDSEIIIGHTRKASSGGRGLPETQPFDEDNIVLAHNGTLHDWEKLANKYNIDSKQCLTDSHFLTKALNNKDFDVLKEYRGGATLVWYYKDEPDAVYIFKGSSPSYNSATTNTEERPLYGAIVNNSFYWSSLKRPLTLICDNDDERDTIFDIDTNKILKFDLTESKVTWIELLDIDRSDAGQRPQTVQYNNHHTYNNKKNPFMKANVAIASTSPDYGSLLPFIINKKYITNSSINTFNDWYAVNELSDETVNLSDIYGDEYFFIHGRYYNAYGKPLSGIKYLSIDEKKASKISNLYVMNDFTTVAYFYNGIRFKNYSFYNDILISSNPDKFKYGTEAFANLVKEGASQPVFYANKYDTWFCVNIDIAVFTPSTELCTGLLNIEYGMFMNIVPEGYEVGTKVKYEGKAAFISAHSKTVGHNMELTLSDGTIVYASMDELEDESTYNAKETDDSEMFYDILGELIDGLNDAETLFTQLSNTEAEIVIKKIKEFKEFITL